MPRFRLLGGLASKWRGRVEDQFFVREREAFLAWIGERGGLRSDEGAALLLDAEEFFVLDGSGRWRRQWRYDARAGLAFVLCRPGELITRLRALAITSPKDDWHPLHRSARVEIWECRSRHKGRPLPLRFGFSGAEKILVAETVRQLLAQVLAGESIEPPHELPGRFDDRQTLDVAVWVNGRLCASVIIEGLPCRQALVRAVERVPKDGRFQPLELDELGQASIEMTMMSDLHMPISEAEFVRGDIDATKGYYVRSRGKRGWYIPEVHNVMAFAGLNHLLDSLAHGKAGIETGGVDARSFTTFSVSDWIETEKGIATLNGPVAEMPSTLSLAERVRQGGKAAARQLLALIDSHGALPAIIDPGRGARNAMDWPRISCAGHALAMYGKSLGDAEAMAGANKIYAYLKRYAPFHFLTVSKNILTRVYFSRLALELGGAVDGDEIAQLVRVLKGNQLEPISRLQLLSLLLENHGQNPGQVLVLVMEEASRLFEHWESKRAVLQLALYPELIAVCQALARVTGDDYWEKKAHALGAWYMTQQLPDGSWPHSPGRMFAYTRGTGKIFEVLALYPDAHQKPLERSWQWLSSMQYTPENTYHLRPDERGVFVGGFRHDAFNRELWIDGSAHIMLGVARWHQWLNHQ